jgi:hypothetical protein
LNVVQTEAIPFAKETVLDIVQTEAIQADGVQIEAIPALGGCCGSPNKCEAKRTKRMADLLGVE